jgi:aryl-alcohol dehydrogenase-like predicted oxidoreductase
MLAAARAGAGADHRFRVLQLPLNLLESGAVRRRNQGSRTVLEATAAEGVAVLVNRPLNALSPSGLLRLADVPAETPAGEWGQQLETVRTLESEYRETIAAHLQTEEGDLPPDQFFRWADELASLDPQVRSLDHWDQLERRIRGRASGVLRALDEGLAGTLGDAWHAWRARYLPELQALLALARGRAALRSAAAVRAVRDALEPAVAERSQAPLSQLALWTIASTPGVTCTLVGMRREAYVDDAMSILAWPPLPDPAAVYERTAALAKE